MQRKVFRVKGIIPRRSVKEVLNSFSEVYLTKTPQIRVTRTFQDQKSDKMKMSGKKKRNRKGYDKYVYIEFKSNNQSDMVALHEVVERFFVPAGDISKL